MPPVGGEEGGAAGMARAGEGVQRRAAEGFRAVPLRGSVPGGIGKTDRRGVDGREEDRAGRLP